MLQIFLFFGLDGIKGGCVRFWLVRPQETRLRSALIIVVGFTMKTSNQMRVSFQI